MVLWLSAELDLYLTEALRTFGLLCGYWKQRATLNTSAAASFYDLTVECPAAFGQTVLDQDLVTQIEYHLLETPSPTAWAGTEMFTLDDITQAIQRRRNQFLLETGCVLTHSSVSSLPPPVSRFPLADNVIDVRRLAWIDSGGSYNSVGVGYGIRFGLPKNGLTGTAATDLQKIVVNNLWREDEEIANAFMIRWNLTPGSPLCFSVALTPPLQVQLFPALLDVGNLDMVSLNTGADLDPTSGVLLGIPDDLSWVVKWGALADLLNKDGPGRDVIRAAYCEERWNFGLDLANLLPSVLQAYINDVGVRIDALADLDAFCPNWQNEQGEPQFMGMSGLNLLALAPRADATPWSVTMDVVCKAPIPATDGDFIQVGREELDVILGYAEHLALWKKGAFDIKSSLGGWQSLVEMAALKNDRLTASTTLLNRMLGKAGSESRSRPRVQEHEEEEAVG
jgi:hypothetical protein